MTAGVSKACWTRSASTSRQAGSWSRPARSSSRWSSAPRDRRSPRSCRRVRASRVPPLAAMRDVAVEQRDRRIVAARRASPRSCSPPACWRSSPGCRRGRRPRRWASACCSSSPRRSCTAPRSRDPAALLVGAPLPSDPRRHRQARSRERGPQPQANRSHRVAVLIGVGIIAFFLAMCASHDLRRSTTSSTTSSWAIASSTRAPSGSAVCPTEVTRARQRACPSVDRAAGFRVTLRRDRGIARRSRSGVDPEDGVRPARLRRRRGLTPRRWPSSTRIAVFEGRAEDKGWSIGDEIEVVFAEAGAKPTTVAMIFEQQGARRRLHPRHANARRERARPSGDSTVFVAPGRGRDRRRRGGARSTAVTTTTPAPSCST